MLDFWKKITMAEANDIFRRELVVRFGPFELHVRAGELRKHGIPVKLREQPFRILVLLVSHPGEMVLREEIRLSLWPNNTIVDFDHNINAAINKLRNVLGESAENRRYIETVGRRGYRFIGVVEEVKDPNSAPLVDAPSGPLDDLPNDKAMSRYRLLDTLGRGGMGVVFRAEDLALHRQVALKFLSEDYAGNPPLQERFHREARAAAALNHPNICTIYDIGEHESRPFIAMELLDGHTLADRLAGRALPVKEAVNLAIQILDGLDAAHRRGIIHRDIKPANLFVVAPARGRSEQAKILDFGLAKLLPEAAPSAVDPAHVRATARPAASHLTVPGAPMGTASYMSPEQVRQEELDARSDLFSFGVVLYEMLSGQPAFHGTSPAELTDAILKSDPPELAIVPRQLDRIVRRCLEKDRERRFQSAADLRFALISAPDSERPQLAPKQTHRAWIWSSFIAALVCLSSYWLIRRSLPAASLPDAMFSRLTSDSGLTTDAVISSDGKFVAYASDRADPGNLDIFVQQVDGSGNAVRITDDPSDDDQPAFSPDGSQIAFRSAREGGGIFLVSALGGQARLLIPGGEHPRFSPDGRMLCYAISGKPQGNGLFVQNMRDSVRRQIGAACDLDSPGGVWSPDSARILFSAHCNVSGGNPTSTSYQDHASARAAVWISTLDGKLVRNRQFDDLGDYTYEGNSIQQWLANPSRVLATHRVRDAVSILEAPVSPDGAKATGPRRQLTFAGLESAASASSSGRVALTYQNREEHIWSIPIDGRGRATGDLAQLTFGFADSYPSLSQDGLKLAFASSSAGSSGIYFRDLAAHTQRLLPSVSLSASSSAPFLNPEGTKIVFQQLVGGLWSFYEEPVMGGAARTLWGGTKDWLNLYSWSPDGATLLFNRAEGGAGVIRKIDLRTLKDTPFLNDPEFEIFDGNFSHDGRWVCFNAVKEGHSRIFIAPFRSTTVPRSDWIPVTDGPLDEKQKFSNRDDLIFFSSNRDGHLCIWAQALTRDKRPQGSPFPVYHAHQRRRSLANVTPSGWTIVVGPRLIVLNQAQLSGNIWLMELPDPAVR